MTSRFDIADIRRYYDRHTASFVRYGQGGGSLHRAVWGPGVAGRDRAFHYVDEQIAALIRARLPADAAPHVLDLGCGVGATLCYLARQLQIRGTGITLSGAQAKLARARVAAEGFADRIDVLEGDFNDLPASLAPVDLAYAIESFVHGPSPVRFFEQCGRTVRTGGLLVVCDDVRRVGGSSDTERAIERFERGWHINALLGRDEVIAMAHGAGFELESVADLTPYLELGRVRDRLAGALVTVMDRLGIDLPRFDYLAGGCALQACLAQGLVGYDLFLFRRSQTAT